MTEEKKPYRWGMVIDLDRCTGCEACVVACHAENNIRISGQDEASQGRAVNWIRIERYWEGTYPNVSAKFMCLCAVLTMFSMGWVRESARAYNGYLIYGVMPRPKPIFRAPRARSTHIALLRRPWKSMTRS